MQIGVRILERPQNWTILQQRNEFASVVLGGDWFLEDDMKQGRTQVCVRVVREDDGGVVIPWTPCSMLIEARWNTTVENIPVGGLYRIETCLQIDNNPAIEWACRGDMIHHIAVGDVWIIAGQSNSAGYGRGTLYDPPELGIHLLRNSGQWDIASHPFNESTNIIHPENREWANPAHSPYLAFGRTVKRLTRRPVGFIQTALGGTPLKAWDPDDDGYLYKNMLGIVDMVGSSVSGVLWYQGESDANEQDADTYLSRFKRMVFRLREDLNASNLPVLTVQLNRHTAPCDGMSDRYWGKIREAQRMAAREIDHVFVIPSLDCALSDQIHNSPAGNLLIGERLAQAYFHEIYQGHCYRAPDLARATMELSSEEGSFELPTIILHFDNVQGRLSLLSSDHDLFVVEDDHGKVQIRKVEVLESAEICLVLGRDTCGPVFVHGAYQTHPSAWLPTDTQTYMPMLSFFGVAVTTND